MSFLKKYFSGHIKIGPAIIYGMNAMHWAVNIKSKKYGYICFRLPFRCFGRWWPVYFYLSPNATPWAATFYIGGTEYSSDKVLAPVRRLRFGHNFDTEKNGHALRQINDIL